MKYKVFYLAFCLSFISIIVQGQSYSQKGTVYVERLSINVGWYNPAMDYWNDEFLPKYDVRGSFNGGVTYGAQLLFQLPANVQTRFGIARWSDKVEGETNSMINSLKIGMTSFELAAIYSFEMLKFKDVVPYLGIEGQYNIIKNKFHDGEQYSNQQGQDYSFAPFIGINRHFGRFNVGVDFKYNIGKYVQDVYDGLNLSEEEVSINGIEFNISLGYKLYNDDPYGLYE